MHTIKLSAVVIISVLLMSQVYTQTDSTFIQLAEVQVTANRIKQSVRKVPASIQIIGEKTMQAQVFQNTDGILNFYQGFNVFRPFGIFGSSNVGLRGITGIEQSRVLVMENGVPVNVSDLGRVNWNRFNPLSLQRIEVIRGPESSVYGGSAMGGVVNLLSKGTDTLKLSGNAMISYATYNTMATAVAVNGSPLKNKKLYYGIQSFYRQSDGYINQPDSLRDSTSIASWMNEFGIGLKTGYYLKPDQRIEIQYDYYDDRRSQGVQIIHPEGNYTDHDTHFLRALYAGTAGKLRWYAQVYYQQENYFRNAESFKKYYSLFQVISLRKDAGILSTFSHSTEKNTLTFGVDLKSGSVDGADEYQTSSDVVRNQGRMDQVYLYITDQFQLTPTISLSGSLQFTHAWLRYANFTIEGNSGNSDILLPYQNDTSGQKWNQLSPRIALQYSKDHLKIYGSFSTGFRPPVLDDLTRSGFIAGAFKVANPNLGPEDIHTYEIGSLFEFRKIKLSLTGYLTNGFNFMHYVETGGSIGKRPVLQKQNITNVRVFGSEFSINFQVSKLLELFGNATYNFSSIRGFADQPGLIGNQLTYSPVIMANAGMVVRSKYINAASFVKYTGRQFLDDANTLTIPAIYLWNLKLWYNFDFGLYIEVSGENLLNQQYLLNFGQLSIGRFLSTTIGYRF